MPFSTLGLYIAIIVASHICFSVSPWVVLWVLFALLSGLPFILRERGKGRDLVAPIKIFVLYFFIGMGIRGLCLVTGVVKNRFLAPMSDDLLMYSYMLCCICLICLYAGYYGSWGLNVGLRLKRSFSLLSLRDSLITAKLFGNLCGFVGLVSFYFFYRNSPTSAEFGTNPAEVAFLSKGGGIYVLSMLAQWSVFGFLILLRRGIGILGLFSLLINFTAIACWFLVAGRKGLLIEFLIGVFLLRHYSVKKFSLKGFFLIGTGLVAISIVGFHYRAFGTELSKWSLLAPGDLPLPIKFIYPLIERSYHFDMLLIVLDHVHGLGDLALGSTLSELGYFFVPRAWWPDKPISFGYLFGSIFLDAAVQRDTSYATSVVAEVFFNFHLPGLILFFSAIGVLLQIVYVGFSSSGKRLSVIFYSLLFWRMIHFVEGPIASHLIFTMSTLMPAVAYFIFLLVFQPNPKRMAALRPFCS